MSALDPLSEAAVSVVDGLVKKAGVELDPAVVVAIASELIQWGVELVDESAKKKADAAGKAAAAAIVTEEQAEAHLRKKS